MTRLETPLIDRPVITIPEGCPEAGSRGDIIVKSGVLSHPSISRTVAGPWDGVRSKISPHFKLFPAAGTG
jgi:hypothetical protein